MFSLAADIQKRNGRRTSKERFGRKGARRNEPLNEEKRTQARSWRREEVVVAASREGRGGRVCTDEDREKTRINTDRDRE